MHNHVVIHWFRQDLRLSDNPALATAAKNGKVLPVYILDDDNAGKYRMGAASRWWLHHSLQRLQSSLNECLLIARGDPKTVLLDIARRYEAKSVYWNRCYEPWRIARDTEIKLILNEQGIESHSFNGSLLWKPWDIAKQDGTPYKVFTPYYRKGCLGASAPREPLPQPSALRLLKPTKNADALDALTLLPTIRWDKQLAPHWIMGEQGAIDRLYAFFDEGLQQYKDGRNFPARPHVSRLSPHLHFGEISPNQVWYAATARGDNAQIDHFCSELGWREFSYYLLYHFPALPQQNLNSRFDPFPWRDDHVALRAWQQGKTGYPIIDAGMRELWQTGYMHNRVRMIVGSFLVKNLLLHWHCGERWFWDCLVDADLANNSAGWQWIAGCGADAAPYFRIFNPVTQGQKFDPEGVYTRRYVPELSALPNDCLFSPWEAPEHTLKYAGIALGRTYPKPIVDIKTSRDRALKAFASLKT